MIQKKKQVIYSCYTCKDFKRIKDIPIIQDLDLNIEGACYNHTGMDYNKPLAMPVYDAAKGFPKFCGLPDEVTHD